MKRTAILIASAVLLTAATAMPARADDEYCREYTRDIKIGGHVEKAYGTACQQPDGSWQIQPDEASPGSQRVDSMPPNRVIMEENYVPNRYYGSNVIIVRREPIFVHHPRRVVVIDRGYHGYGHGRHYGHRYRDSGGVSLNFRF